MSLYYQDDYVTLYHGDCIKEHREWLSADVLVTDPPYGYDHSSNWDGKFKGEVIANDSTLDARDQVLAAWGKSALVFGSWMRPKPTGTHTVLIWDKGENAGMGDLAVPWKPNTEEIYVIGKSFAGSRGSSVLTGHSVVTWASKGREHPNMKPVTLAKRCAQEVLDIFGGAA